MEMTASLHFSHSSLSLKPAFSDQSHLVFYGGSSSASFRPTKTHHLHTTMACSATPPLAALPPAQPLPSPPATCSSVPCNAVTSTRSESELYQELSLLKEQVKQKKKQLKAMAKEKKKALKGKKPKAKCESSSSSSESCDEENTSINMRLWKEGLPLTRDDDGLTEVVSVADELNGSHAEVGQECVGRNPKGITLNGFSFQWGTQNQLLMKKPAQNQLLMNKPAQNQLHRELHGAVMDLAIAAPAHGSVQACARTGKVEVCVGGKCKKAGSQQLLASLRSQIPASTGVEAMACKCMGKCAMAINVKVQKEDTNPQSHSHVGVNDGGLILSHHFGLGPPQSGLPFLLGRALPMPAVQTAMV